MDANIGLLQEEIIKSVNLKSDDLILLALAGLKQASIAPKLISDFIFILLISYSIFFVVVVDFIFERLKVRDQLNPAFGLNSDASEATKLTSDTEKREVKYGKYQQHQLVQTSFDTSSQPADDESTSTLIRRRLSSFLKPAESSSDDKDDKSLGEIKGRLRSLSLKSGSLLADAASNLMTTLSGGAEQSSYLKRVEQEQLAEAANDPARDSAIGGLDDEEQTSANMKLGNAKLVLNTTSVCKDANSNEIVDNNFVLIERN
jgi:hypothetical protein